MRGGRVIGRSARLACVLAAAALVGGGGRPAAVEVRKVGAAVPDDATLARTVEQRISGRPGIDASRVTVIVLEGGLTLSGVVATLYERTEIEKFASAVRGLRSVENKIELDRGDASDPVLESNALREIEFSPRLRAFRLKASVAGGVLTLEGEVTLARDRLEAEESASQVRGIVAVENRIRLAPHPLDPQNVKGRLERLLRDRLIFGGVEDLQVEVSEGGEVSLEGVVATPADRMRAERLAYGIRGVVTVRNGLQIRRFAPASP